MVLGVKELRKPALRWCEHCSIGKGCGIYDGRPESCREFSCLWLSHPETPEAMKPRLTGVVIWITGDGKNAIALTRRHDPTAWRKPSVLPTLRKLARGLTVIAFSGTRAWLIGPERDEELPREALELDGYGLNKLTITPEMKRRMGVAA
jgi:hypothetical protein